MDALDDPNRRWNVLVADADEDSLLSLEKVFEECNHKVTKCKNVDQCLEIFQEKEGKFHLVIIDVSMPNLIDGYELSRCIRKETDIPIILMSPTYSSADSVPKVLEYGACDFQLKPMDAEAVRNIDLERLRNLIRQESSFGNEEQEFSTPHSRDTLGYITSVEDQNDVANTCLTEKRSGESIAVLDQPPRKKQRVVWTPELHDKFVSAVNKFGLERAVPKKIMEVMKVPDITRENVASHLQKYRQYQKKQEQGDSQQKQKQVQQQPRRQQEQEERKPTEPMPDHQALKAVYPPSALAHASALNEPSLPDGKVHGGFKIGCQQVPNWTDVAPDQQQPGFQGPFVDHMMVPEYETAYDPSTDWRHPMLPYKQFVDMYDNHRIDPGFDDAYNGISYQPLPMQMAHHQSATQLPNEADGAIIPQYDNTEFAGYHYDDVAGLPLMAKIEHNCDDHSDFLMGGGDTDLQGNNTMCYSYANGNMEDSTFPAIRYSNTSMGMSSFGPNPYQSDQQFVLNDNLLGPGYYDPTLYVDHQLDQGGAVIDQPPHMYQKSADKELGFKDDLKDQRADEELGFKDDLKDQRLPK